MNIHDDQQKPKSKFDQFLEKYPFFPMDYISDRYNAKTGAMTGFITGEVFVLVELTNPKIQMLPMDQLIYGAAYSIAITTIAFAASGYLNQKVINPAANYLAKKRTNAIDRTVDKLADAVETSVDKLCNSIDKHVKN